jgi:glycosyltransferase involved in cell wall biosynthesis
MASDPSRLTPAISVVICTHNPDPATFARTLQALAAQTLPPARWELVVVDNASTPAVQLSAPAGITSRCVVEALPGLTRARIRGVHQACGPLLVFVDDDNLLAPDYLEQAARLADEFPLIGAFGGRIEPEFQATEPEWLRPFRSHLALADFSRDEWSNVAANGVLPCGAGLCIRRPLALAYANAVEADPQRAILDRSGDGTMSCGDTDMVLTCLDAGWGTARFTALRLTHVIRASRLDYNYQRRLARDIGYSYGRLLAIRGETSRGRRAIAAVRTALALVGVKHRGRARVLDYDYHYGYWRGLWSGRQ